MRIFDDELIKVVELLEQYKYQVMMSRENSIIVGFIADREDNQVIYNPVKYINVEIKNKSLEKSTGNGRVYYGGIISFGAFRNAMILTDTLEVRKEYDSIEG